jgi:signal transduction histidine kinase
MTSHGYGGQSPTAFTAAALRRAVLLPLALATITGALVLGLAEHVRIAVEGETEDEREVYAVDSLYRRLSDDEMALHSSGAASARKTLSDVPTHLTTLERAGRRHTKIAQSIATLSNLVREWMHERERIGALPPAQAADEEQRLIAMRAQLDALTAELLRAEGADEASVRRRFAEMLALVAVLSVVLGVVVAIYVRRDLVVVSKAFSEKLDAEQETSRIKDDFVATLSHELKTPINAILGWTTLLRRRSEDAVTRRRALDRIERNARKQARLVDDIVDMSCIVTGKLALSCHSLDVLSIVESAVASAQAAAEMKGIRIVLAVAADAGSIWGDARRVRQVLVNLVDNAVKFAPSGGRVIVGATRAGDAVQLRVSDSGQGVPTDFVPYAFGAFRQSDSSASRTHGGLGLGLAIVRRLVELHGGSVAVQSPGEAGGATFVVTLPSPVRLS